MIFGGIRVSAKFFLAARTKLWHLCIFAFMSPSYFQWSNSLLVLQIVQRIEISLKVLAIFTPFRSQRGVKISSQLLFSLKIEENQLRKLTILSKKRTCKKDLQLMSPGRWAARTILLSQLLFSLQQKHSLRRGSRPLINGEKWIANASTSQPAHMLANSAPVGNTNPIFKPDWTPRFRPTSANPDFP